MKINPYLHRVRRRMVLSNDCFAFSLSMQMFRLILLSFYNLLRIKFNCRKCANATRVAGVVSTLSTRTSSEKREGGELFVRTQCDAQGNHASLSLLSITKIFSSLHQCCRCEDQSLMTSDQTEMGSCLPSDKMMIICFRDKNTETETMTT